MTTDLTKKLLIALSDPKLSEQTKVNMINGVVSASQDLEKNEFTKDMVVNLNHTDIFTVTANGQQREQSLLAIAASLKNQEVVARLIQLGVDLNNALFWALKDREFVMVGYIYAVAKKYSFTPDVMKPITVDKSKTTNLHQLAKEGLTEFLLSVVSGDLADKEQIAKLANIVELARHFAKDKEIALDFNHAAEVDIQGKGKRNRSLLSIAVTKQNKGMVNSLIQLGSDVVNALHWAVVDGLDEMVRLILTLVPVDIHKAYLSPNKADKNKSITVFELIKANEKSTCKNLLDCHASILTFANFSSGGSLAHEKFANSAMFSAFAKAYELDKNYLLSHLKFIVNNVILAKNTDLEAKSLYLLDALRVLHFICAYPGRRDEAVYAEWNALMALLSDYDLSISRAQGGFFKTPSDLTHYMSFYPEVRQANAEPVASSTSDIEEKVATVTAAPAPAVALVTNGVTLSSVAVSTNGLASPKAESLPKLVSSTNGVALLNGSGSSSLVEAIKRSSSPVHTNGHAQARSSFTSIANEISADSLEVKNGSNKTSVDAKEIGRADSVSANTAGDTPSSQPVALGM